MATRRCHTAALSTPSKNCSTQRSVLMRTSPTDRSRTPSAPMQLADERSSRRIGRPGHDPHEREAERRGLRWSSAPPAWSRCASHGRAAGAVGGLNGQGGLRILSGGYAATRTVTSGAPCSVAGHAPQQSRLSPAANSTAWRAPAAPSQSRGPRQSPTRGSVARPSPNAAHSWGPARRERVSTSCRASHGRWFQCHGAAATVCTADGSDSRAR